MKLIHSALGGGKIYQHHQNCVPESWALLPPGQIFLKLYKGGGGGVKRMNSGYPEEMGTKPTPLQVEPLLQPA